MSNLKLAELLRNDSRGHRFCVGCVVVFVFLGAGFYAAAVEPSRTPAWSSEYESDKFPQPELYADMNIQPPFGDIIKEQTNLLIYGGVEAVAIGNDLYLLAVGWTEAREITSSAEFTRRIHVARSVARAELIRMFASQVEMRRILSATENRDVLSTYLTEHARDILGGVIPVGSWLSPDRSVYYEAIIVKTDMFSELMKGKGE